MSEEIRQLIREEIEKLPINFGRNNDIKRSLQNILDGAYEGELDKITIYIYNYGVRIGVGFNMVFSPDQIPTIWNWLKKTGQAREVFNNHEKKIQKEINSLKKAIQTAESNLRTVESLLIGEKDDHPTR